MQFLCFDRHRFPPEVIRYAVWLYARFTLSNRDVDFGEAVVVIGGVEQKAHFFVLDLPHSDACYVRAYPVGSRFIPQSRLAEMHAPCRDCLARFQALRLRGFDNKND